jgi:hypothetical protein
MMKRNFVMEYKNITVIYDGFTPYFSWGGFFSDFRRYQSQLFLVIFSHSHKFVTTPSKPSFFQTFL